jgi:hypothetical protein
MPHIRDELHLRRRERIVLGKLEFGGEDAAFERCAFGALDQGFPEEHVVFGDGTRGYAFGWVGGEGFVLFEEAFGGAGCHGAGCEEVVVGYEGWWE